MEKYDVIIAGGGPAGSIAAKTIADKGYEVLMVEKRQEFGRPVRCAEGVSKKWLEKHTGIKDRWISKKIKGAILKSSTGKVAKMKYDKEDIGFILDRSIFDFDLAVDAANHGAVIRSKNTVVDAKRENKKIIVEIDGNHSYFAECNILIAADGVEARVPNMLGVDTNLQVNDVEYGLNYQLENVNIQSDYIEMIGGNSLAPGGYIWIFPKGEKSANVGLGVLAKRSKKEKNAKYYLDKFVQKRFPNASISKTVAGAVTVAKPLKNLAYDNFMIAGDAARLSNPLTGAGIGNALESGYLSGITAVKALEKKDYSKKILKKYHKKVMKSVGNTSKYFYKIKEAFIEFSDKDIDNMISLLSKVDPKDLGLKKLLKIAFKDNKEVISLLKKVIF